MQKIILDANVFVSALIQKGIPYHIVYDFFLEDKIRLCVSESLLEEYHDVLARPKFSQFQEFAVKAETLLFSIELKGMRYDPKLKLDLISDKDDNKIIELADECSADFIITGNTTDFTFPAYKMTTIVTPRTYWERYKPG